MKEEREKVAELLQKVPDTTSLLNREAGGEKKIRYAEERKQEKKKSSSDNTKHSTMMTQKSVRQRFGQHIRDHVLC